MELGENETPKEAQQNGAVGHEHGQLPEERTFR